MGRVLTTSGLRSGHLRALSLASVGLWPPTLWLMGDSLERHLSSLDAGAGRRR